MSSRSIVSGPSLGVAQAIASRRRAGAGGGGGAASPVAVAEANGIAYYSPREPASYLVGTGSSTERYQAFYDLTPSQHLGTKTDQSAPDHANLCDIESDAFGNFMRTNVGTTDQFRMQTAPETHHIGHLQAFKFPYVESVTQGYVFMGSDFGQPRPYVLFNSITGGWTVQTSGGGSADLTKHTEGNNIAATNNPLDGNWHVFLFHHNTSANEGLIFELDGEVLIPDNSSYSQNDPGGHFGPTTLRSIHDNVGASNLNTLDIGDFAFPKAANDTTHAQTRELAEAMMGVYGITSLA